jgi:transcriptional regulator with XRE-family HTH domain
VKRFTLKDFRNAVPGTVVGPPLTVRELARLANISAGHLSNIENGSDPASPRLLWRIAMARGAPYRGHPCGLRGDAA